MSVPGKLLKLWDFSIGVGGPVFRDRLWYYGVLRDRGLASLGAGHVREPERRRSDEVDLQPDLTRQSRSASSYRIANLRLTVQATPRNKFGVFWDEQKPCGGAPWSAASRGLPHSARRLDSSTAARPRSRLKPAAPAPAARAAATCNNFQRVQQATWSSPVSNRFLLEAGFGTYLARYGSNELPGNPTRNMVRVVEQCAAGCAVNGSIPNLAYRSHNWEDNWNGAHTWRALGVVRDRRAQHEVRLPGRVPLVQPEDVHQRSVPAVSRQQRRAEPAHADAACRSTATTASATRRSTRRSSGRAGG